MIEVKNLRKIFVNEVIKAAKSNNKIVCLDSDSKEPTFMDLFSQKFPDRSFSFGIAEQDMVSAAGGMATMDLIPIVNSYALFIAMRALDQVRNGIAYPNLNVKFNLSHHGLDIGSDGITHQLTEDISIFRSIPNIKLLQPLDDIEMIQMVKFMLNTKGPVIIKSGKTSVPTIHDKKFKWIYGTPSVISPGEKIAIITNGVISLKALKAKNILLEEKICNPKVINLSSLTDINSEALLNLLSNVEFIVTLEDHSVYGGLGSIITEICSEHYPIKIKRLGLNGVFAECGKPEELFNRYNMDENAIISAVKKFLKE